MMPKHIGIDKIIFKELVNGAFTEKSRHDFNDGIE
jgi:hypothetical protein